MGTVAALSRAADVSVLGTTPNYATVRKNLRILRALPGRGRRRAAQQGCVVSHQLYQDLFGSEPPGSKTLRTSG